MDTLLDPLILGLREEELGGGQFADGVEGGLYLLCPMCVLFEKYKNDNFAGHQQVLEYEKICFL